MAAGTDTSLTTGARGARGKKKNKLAVLQQREQKQSQRLDRRELAGKPVTGVAKKLERTRKKEEQLGYRVGGSAPPGTPATPQPPTTGANPAGPPSGTPGTPPDLATQLQPYTAPLPPIIKAYMDKLSAGMINAPTWQERTKQFTDVANLEAQRQSAGIKESMGSMGTRYGSSIMGAESDLARKTSADIAAASGQFQQQAEQQQFNELSAVGALAYGSGEAGMTRYWQDFLRQTSPPPFVGAGVDVSGGYGLPATVVGG